MKTDRPVVAAILGSASTLAGEAVTRAFVMMGVGTHDSYQIDSILITINRPSVLFGLLVNIMAGGVIGVLLYYALERLGSACILFKAVSITLLAWFGVECFIAAFLEGKYIDIRPLSDYAIHIVGALASGVLLGLLFKWVLFKKPRNKEYEKEGG